MSRQRIFIIIGIVMAVIFGWLIFVAISNTGKGMVKTQRAPSTMTFSIDGKKTKAMDLRLTKGEHTLKGTAPNFKEVTQKITVKAGETQEIVFTLPPADFIGETWLNEHPDEAALYSVEGSRTFDENSAAMTDNNPIIFRLPMYGPGWTVTYAQSPLKPNDPAAVAVHIWGADPGLRQEALRWIRGIGFDPTDLEIIIDKD